MNSANRSESRPRGAEPHSAPELILGLDNVPIELPVARVGSRVLAAVVDYTLLFILLIGWVLGVTGLSSFVGLEFGWAIGILLLGAFLLEYGYFAAQEVLLRGQTLGKRWLGLRVVSRDGAEADSTQLLLRNLVRTLDVLVGVVLMAVDPLARRLGDRLAGTLVIHSVPAGEELILSRVPDGWRREEIEVVEAFLRRAPVLEPSERQKLAFRLTSWVDTRAPGFLPVEGGDPLIRLRRGFVSPAEST